MLIRRSSILLISFKFATVVVRYAKYMNELASFWTDLHLSEPYGNRLWLASHNSPLEHVYKPNVYISSGNTEPMCCWRCALKTLYICEELKLVKKKLHTNVTWLVAVAIFCSAGLLTKESILVSTINARTATDFILKFLNCPGLMCPSIFNLRKRAQVGENFFLKKRWSCYYSCLFAWLMI